MSKNNPFFRRLEKIKKTPDRLQGAFSLSIRNYGKQITEAIRKSITTGRSPVEGKGRFVDYSDSYKTQIGGRFKNAAGEVIRKRSSNKMSTLGKKARPVNLTLSGVMMKSLYYRVVGSKLQIAFGSALAAYHTIFGAGKRRVIRSLLPAFTGERLSRTVFDRFDRLIKKDLLKSFRIK